MWQRKPALKFVVLILGGVSVAVLSARTAQAQTSLGRTPVLVELYTSEGCSTCPPADDLLADMAEHQPIPGVLVVPLAEHVDYWNQLGWTDRFSSSVYSQRQRVYAKNMKATEVYTPQMVIGGTRESPGSDRPSVVRAITAVAKTTTGALTVTRSGASEGTVQVSVTLSGAGAGEAPGLYAVVTDDEDTTMVGGGENGGHSLHHVAAVRSMQYFGAISDGQQKLLAIKLPDDAAKRKLHLVVFAQLTGQGRIVAAASSPI